MFRRHLLPVFGLALLVACGDSDDNGGANGGGTPDAGGPSGPDMDGDEWLDDADNCPAIANAEQRDRDNDGIGDACDSCPATPNADAVAGDDPCQFVEEAEPNNEPSEAQPLTLVPRGQFREVRGVVENPRAGAQSVDRFSLTVEKGQLIRIRVARASADSRIEPGFSVTGPDFAPREAEDRFVAEREVYFPRAGTYEIAIGDRRGLFGDTPRGGDTDAYALAIFDIPVETRSVEIGSQGFDDRLFAFEDPNSITFLESTITEDQRFSFFTTKTELGQGNEPFGLDTILLVELGDAAADIYENDDVGRGVSDSQILLEEVGADIPVRIVLDHARRVGPVDVEYEIRLTVQQYDILPELEPNDTFDVASPLQFPDPCQTPNRETTEGGIESRSFQADTDWYTFSPEAGSVVRFEVSQTAGNFEPVFEIAQLRGGAPFTLFGADGESSALLTTIFPEAGDYLLHVDHGPNLGDVIEGGPLFTYRVLAECVAKINAGTILGTDPNRAHAVQNGDIGRWALVPTQVLIADVLIADAKLGNDPDDPLAPDIGAAVQILGPGGAGLLARGTGIPAGIRAAALLDIPNPDPAYLMSVINPADFRGFAYRVATQFEPVTPIDEPATEPNNRLSEAEVIDQIPFAVAGNISPDDPDFVQFTSDGSELHLFANAGNNTIGLLITDTEGNTVQNQANFIRFRQPAGDYVIRATSTVETDYTLILTDPPPSP
jgi:hypothetical protein